jgi:uncharacterized membrane protein
MIRDPFLIVCLLLAIEALVLYLEGQRRFKKYFSFIPHVFWIYFLPMLIATAGLIDTKNWVLTVITTHLLPASLFLLLLSVDIKAILRLGWPALVMMSAGSFGIILGTTASFAVFQNIVGKEFWSGFGSLAASWTGGSANMIAVKEAIHTPEHVFLPMVVVDTINPYIWMGLLVALAGWQRRFDQWNHADRTILEALKTKVPDSSLAKRNHLRTFPALVLVLLALGVSLAAQALAAACPEVKDVISQYTWTIIIVSSLGIVASFTPVKGLDDFGATKVGYFLLYFVLTSIGAKANLGQLGTALPLILAGFIILIIHAAVLLLTAKLMRAPMFLVAVASQANVGGVASAPIVAEIYQSGYASVGLLLAIFGNIIGTYVGILTSQICRMIG